MKHKYFVMGLDLGQAQDYSALAICERVDIPIGEASSRADQEVEGYWHVRHLERFRLGTPYPEIVERVSEMWNADPLKDNSVLVLDITGVGAPVWDMFIAANLPARAITITGGNQVIADGRKFSVPKRDLVSTLQVLIQKGRIKFAEDLPDVQTLIKELLAFQVKISASGHDSYEAWREGAHDDLVLALAMAVWLGQQRRGLRL